MLKFSWALLCGVALIAQPLANQGLAGRRAPSFSLPDVRLQQHDILDYRGKWLLLDFMKTDCPHCKELSKKLEGVMGKYRGKVEVLGVVLPPDNQQTVSRYIMETKITSPIVFDSSQTAIPYFKATPSTPGFDTPHLFAIDPNGMIVKDWGQAAVESPGFLGELDQLFNRK
jgi:peroxiredoxin